MKKCLAILISLLLLCASIPLGAVSVSAATSGTTGDCTWTLVDGHLTISGNGAMADYGLWQQPWPCGSVTSITIDEGVTAIGEYAFYRCTELQTIVIPDSVLSIGGDAFGACYNLASVIIGNGVTSIGIRSFELCYNLSSVTFGDSVTTIGKWAFLDCDNLTSVVVPDSVTTINDEAFSYCDSLTTLTLGRGVAHIGDAVFTACLSLKNVSVDVDNPHFCSVDDVLFSKDQTTLIQYPIGKTNNAYVIPDGVTTIGTAAFGGCMYLTSVDIPNSVTVIGKEAFQECENLAVVTIPDSVIIIDEYAFALCYSITSLTLGNSVTTIGESAFTFANITALTIPDSVTSIGTYAFAFTAIDALYLGKGVQTIGEYAFASEVAVLTDVYYTGSEDDRSTIDIDDGNDILLNATWHYNYSPVCTHVYDDDADPDCNLCGVARWVVNPDGDVVVSGKDSGVTLPAGTVVSVEQAAVGSVTPDLSALGNPDAELITVYDITLTVDGESIQPGGVVSVILPIPADAGAYTDLQVVYVDSLGNVTLCETIVNGDGTITFFTDHFSYYAIVGVASATPGDANGDGRINNKDLGLLQQYLNDWTVTIDIDAMDVNKDGRINNKDLGMIQQYLNDWDVTLG